MTSVEVNQIKTLVPAAELPTVEVEVVAEKPGVVTAVDRIKAYYHTIFYAVGGFLVFIFSILPAIEPAWALFDLSTKTRGIISGITLISGVILTKYKANELWVNKEVEDSAKHRRSIMDREVDEER